LVEVIRVERLTLFGGERGGQQLSGLVSTQPTMLTEYNRLSRYIGHGAKAKESARKRSKNMFPR